MSVRKPFGQQHGRGCQCSGDVILPDVARVVNSPGIWMRFYWADEIVPELVQKV